MSHLHGGLRAEGRHSGDQNSSIQLDFAARPAERDAAARTRLLWLPRAGNRFPAHLSIPEGQSVWRRRYIYIFMNIFEYFLII